MSLTQTSSNQGKTAEAVRGGRGEAPRLSRECEAGLIRSAQRGDRRALERLIQGNARLVYKVARRYRCRSYSTEDLVQEGVVGLILAVERFDPDRGCRLSTYAMHWIRQTIARAVEQNDRLIHVPMQRAAEVRRLLRVLSERQQYSGRAPSVVELAEETGLEVARVDELMVTAPDALSLDALVGTEQDASILEIAADPAATSPEQNALLGAYRQQVRHLVRDLRPRERTVLEERFGFDGRSPRTLEELSRTLCVSRERVRQIEAQAIRKLRHALANADWM